MHPRRIRKSDRSHHECAPSADILVVIPVKSFTRAKARLTSALSPDQRSLLARLMAENVIAAARGFAAAVACDQDDVAEWATGLGVDVIRTDGHDLNGAATESLARARSAGWRRLAMVHADLPLAHSLSQVIPPTDDQVVIVPDRRSSGTNVLVLPTYARFRFGFGPGSLARHIDSADRAGLLARTVESPEFSWDVDEPEDLVIPLDPKRPPRGWSQYLEHGLLRPGEQRSPTMKDQGEGSLAQDGSAEMDDMDRAGTRSE